MMYNARYIIPGLGAFLALVTLPFWLNAGKSYEQVSPAVPPPEMARACIESRDYMAASHMKLLYAWRDAATRENKRHYTASDGSVWAISLSNTCMSCHTDKEKFCDACHTAVGASPSCWDCHAVPGPVEVPPAAQGVSPLENPHQGAAKLVSPQSCPSVNSGV